MTDAEWTAFLDRLTPAERNVAQGVLARLEFVLERFRSQQMDDVQRTARRSDGNAQRITQAFADIGTLSDRVHAIENIFDNLTTAVHVLAIRVEALKERRVGDASD